MKQGWEVKKLGDVCDLITCGVAARPQYVDEGIPFLSAKNVKEGKIIWSGYNCISEQTHNELTKNNKPLLGDILYTRVGSYGEAAVIEDDYEFSVFVSLTLIKVSESTVSNYFLKHYLNSDYVKQLAKKSISGSGVGNLNVGTVREFPIKFPSLPEQQRIVAILDEAFASIAKAKANAEQNLKNAKELFESYLQSVFENKGEGWEEKTLGEVCNVIGGGTPSKANNSFYDGDIYWATVRDMKGELLTDTEHKITKDAVKNSSTNIIPKGNVIIATRVGLGKVCLIENDTAINQDLRGVIPSNPNKLSVDFLYRWFKSIAHKIVEEGTGATVQGVKLPFIKSLVIFIPSLQEQQAIVQKLDALSTETKQLEAIYQQKINDLDELKKSILQKAFAGELNATALEV